MPNLRDDLYERAKKFAHQAMSDYQAEDWDAFALHAGTSLELLSKAYLCSLHPSLIMDGLDSLLYACEVPGHVAMPRSAVRTISFTESMKRCGRMLPTIANLTRGDFDQLIAARNSVAHFAGLDDQLLVRIALAYALTVGELLRGLDVHPGAFWETHVLSVEDLVRAATEEVKARVVEKMKGAQDALAKRFKDTPPEMVPILIESIQEAYQIDEDRSLLLECPVCGNMARAEGAVDVDWEGEAEYEGPDEMSYTASPVLTFYAFALRCHICGLALDGGAELEASGLGVAWLLEDVDPTDYLGDPWEDND